MSKEQRVESAFLHSFLLIAVKNGLAFLPHTFYLFKFFKKSKPGGGFATPGHQTKYSTTPSTPDLHGHSCCTYAWYTKYWSQHTTSHPPYTFRNVLGNFWERSKDEKTEE
jgi:hypothetical protein